MCCSEYIWLDTSHSGIVYQLFVRFEVISYVDSDQKHEKMITNLKLKFTISSTLDSHVSPMSFRASSVYLQCDRLSQEFQRQV